MAENIMQDYVTLETMTDAELKERRSECRLARKRITDAARPQIDAIFEKAGIPWAVRWLSSTNLTLMYVGDAYKSEDLRGVSDPSIYFGTGVISEEFTAKVSVASLGKLPVLGADTASSEYYSLVGMLMSSKSPLGNQLNDILKDVSEKMLIVENEDAAYDGEISRRSILKNKAETEKRLAIYKCKLQELSPDDERRFILLDEILPYGNHLKVIYRNRMYNTYNYEATVYTKSEAEIAKAWAKVSVSGCRKVIIADATKLKFVD